MSIIQDNAYRVIEDFSKFNRYTKSQRFDSHKIEVEGSSYALKHARDETSVIQLRNEVLFARAINSQGLAIRAPEVIEFEHTTAVFEWIDSPLLAIEGPSPRLDDAAIDVMVTVLTELDSLVNVDGDFTSPKTSYTRLSAKFDSWAKQPTEHGLLSPAEANKLRSVIDSPAHEITPAFQHGDLSFWHIFNSKTPVVFDGEHASNNHAQFTDFARVYTSQFVFSPESKTLSRLVDEYAKAHELDRKQLVDHALPVFAAKALGKLNDSINDLEDVDYRKAARTQIEAILAGTLPI